MKKQKWNVWITILFAAAALLYGAYRWYQKDGFSGNSTQNITGMRVAQAESGVSEEFMMKTFSDTFFSTEAEEKDAEWEGSANDDESSGSLQDNTQRKAQEETSGSVESEAESDSREENKKMLWVYVCGEVQNPGVYPLTESCRVVDAIEAAGGFTEQAAASYWNLAEMLKDGMKIAVPSLEEAAEDPYGTQNVGRAGKDAENTGKTGNLAEKEPALVNLNTADAALLQTLPGIGEARAADIIAYRQEHGSFDSIEEIMNVSGIKDAVFQKMKDRITV